MAMIEFDPQESRRIEEIYLTPDVVAQRSVVRAALNLRRGEHVLDIGVGPGLLAAEMATEVGPDGSVCGIDPSDSMLAIARTRAHPPGGAEIQLRTAETNRIPYPDSSFDAVVSTQVFEYVKDIPGALAEVHRILRPGGRVLLLDTDWESVVWHSRDNRRMRRVLEAFDEHLVDPYLPRTLRGTLTAAGFAVNPPQIVPLFNVGYQRATYSAGMLELVATFVVGRAGVTADDASDWAEDLRSMGEDYFFSVNRYLFTATKQH